MTPEEIEELLRKLRQQQPGSGEEYPDESETSERMRYTIRTQRYAVGPDGAQPLSAEVYAYDLSDDGGQVESQKFHRRLEDGSILFQEQQLKKLGRCEVLVESEQETVPCGMESLCEICSNCGRKCCRLHRALMARNQETPPELIQAMNRLPEAVIENLIAGKWVCHTCLAQTQAQIEEVDRQERRRRFWQRIWRFITAIWRDEY